MDSAPLPRGALLLHPPSGARSSPRRRPARLPRGALLLLLALGCNHRDVKAGTQDSQAGSAPLAVPKFALDGQRVQRKGDPLVYLVDRGMKRLVPDPPTYTSLFRDTTIAAFESLDDIPTGEPVSQGAVLASGFGDPKVYLVERRGKRFVSSAAAMDRYGLDGTKVQVLPPIVMEAMPELEPLRWPE